MKKFRWKAVAAVAACGLVAGATVGVSGASVRQASASPGVSDTAIRVAGLGTMTSPRLTTYTGMDVGAKVLFNKVNDEGGINGRKIEYVDTFDDEDNNDKNAEQARRIVGSDIFAVVPAISNFFAGAELLQEADIPYFGWGFHQSFCNNKWGFGFTGCLVDPRPNAKNYGWPAIVKSLAPKKIKTMAFQAEDSDAGRRSVPQYERAAPEMGIDVLFADTSMPFGGGADLTPYVQKMVDANPDAAMLVLTAPVAIRYAQALRQAGYKGIVSMPTAYDPRVTGVDGLQDTYHNIGFANFSSENPGTKQMIADVAKYAGPNQSVTQPLASGYLSAMLFTEILKKVGPNVTSKKFLKVANDNFVFDGNGMIGKYSYPNGHKKARPCASLAYLNNKQFTSAVELYCGDGTDPTVVPKGF